MHGELLLIGRLKYEPWYESIPEKGGGHLDVSLSTNTPNIHNLN